MDWKMAGHKSDRFWDICMVKVERNHGWGVLRKKHSILRP